MILSIINLFFYDFIKKLIFFLILAKFFYLYPIFKGQNQVEHLSQLALSFLLDPTRYNFV